MTSIHNYLFIILATIISLHVTANPIKILHMSFHKGCIKDFEYVAHELSLDLTSLFIPDLPQKWLDGSTTGNAVYNIGHERAQKAWEQHQDYFNQFDVILTSDTAPLSRIFLQNKWGKPLIIWICNRFDYFDGASLDCEFPDPEYYALFHDATKDPLVKMIAYTPFEHFYAQSKGINTGSMVIKPCTKIFSEQVISSIPEAVEKSETFFIPPYHNDTNHALAIERLGIKSYFGRYNGPNDLREFKGIIHFPYAWSNLALFENMQLGIPYFIPSKTFIMQLVEKGDCFFQDSPNNTTIELSEWYTKEHGEILIYFDSWQDLIQKLTTTDFAMQRQKIIRYAEEHHMRMMNRWKNIFSELFQNKE